MPVSIIQMVDLSQRSYVPNPVNGVDGIGQKTSISLPNSPVKYSNAPADTPRQ